MFRSLLVQLSLYALCFGLSNEVQAQKQANVWYFADNIGLDFNSSPPRLLRNGQINSNYADGEACSSISDKHGNLLFYTDGNTVWNGNNELMTNGSGLFGWKTTTQTLIAPIPGSSNSYLIFSASYQGNSATPEERGFFYSVVDMSYEQGLGAVTNKNILLCNSTTEKVAGTLHANGKDIWIIMHEWESNAFRAYLVTEDGIDSNPVISRVGKVHGKIALTPPGNEAIGQMKCSSNGKKLALALYVKGGLVEVFDFDNATGRIHLKKTISNLEDSRFGNGLTYGLEFSPSGNFLYFGYAGQLVQMKLESKDFTNDDLVVLNGGSPDYLSDVSQLQLGPDSKIYVAHGGSNLIGIVHDPDLPGLECGYSKKAILIEDIDKPSHLGGGLPNFISSYFFSPEKYYSENEFSIDMPDVFTPNGDDKNPLFRPYDLNFLPYINKAILKIVNRWGKTIFITDNLASGWSGENHPEGVYYWILEFEQADGQTKKQLGWVQLVR